VEEGSALKGRDIKGVSPRETIRRRQHRTSVADCAAPYSPDAPVSLVCHALSGLNFNCQRNPGRCPGL